MPTNRGEETVSERRDRHRQERLTQEQAIIDQAEKEYPTEQMMADLTATRAEKLGITDQQVESLDRIKRVVGKAVHAEAILRLVKEWPMAHVTIEYRPEERDEDTPAFHRRGRGTLVTIWERKPPEDTYSNLSDRYFIRKLMIEKRNHHEDPFIRRRGIELAFASALERVIEKNRCGTWPE